MNRASCGLVLRGCCALALLTMAGCSEFDLPSWVPFQGPASDPLPKDMASTVKVPREQIEDLRKLSDAAAKATPDERRQTSDLLAGSIRQEKDPLIRLEIIRTLGQYPGPSADAILKAAMADADAQVRVTACEAWGRHGGDDAAAVLGEALKGDADLDVRLAAAKALGETHSGKAVAPLGEALADENPAMQYQVVQSLRKTTGKDYGNNVERWQHYVKGEPVQEPSLAERIWHWF